MTLAVVATGERIRDEDLIDEAVKRIAKERVMRGLHWLEENAPEGYVFNLFSFPENWPFTTTQPRYIAKEYGLAIDALLGRAFAVKSTIIIVEGHTIENYPTPSAVAKYLGLNPEVLRTLGLLAQYDERMSTALQEQWQLNMTELLKIELQKLLAERQHTHDIVRYG